MNTLPTNCAFAVNTAPSKVTMSGEGRIAASILRSLQLALVIDLKDIIGALLRTVQRCRPMSTNGSRIALVKRYSHPSITRPALSHDTDTIGYPKIIKR